jgi:hypothetical protein
MPPLTSVITSTATRSNPARHGEGINYNGEPIKKRGYHLGLGLHWPLGARLDLTSGLSWNHLSLKNQIDVVRNERRQSYDNEPYGRTRFAVSHLLHPEGHPYRDLVIGKHEDLEAAELADVTGFYTKWYVPGTATLVLTEYAPAPSVGYIYTPSTRALNLTAYAPGAQKSVIIGLLELVLSTFAPTLPRPLVPVKQVVYLRTAALGSLNMRRGSSSLILRRLPRGVANPKVPTPAVRALTLTRFAPTVRIGQNTTPGTLALVTTGYAPTISTTSDVIVVETAELVLALGFPLVS